MCEMTSLGLLAAHDDALGTLKQFEDKILETFYDAGAPPPGRSTLGADDEHAQEESFDEATRTEFDQLAGNLVSAHKEGMRTTEKLEAKINEERAKMGEPKMPVRRCHWLVHKTRLAGINPPFAPYAVHRIRQARCSRSCSGRAKCYRPKSVRRK